MNSSWSFLLEDFITAGLVRQNEGGGMSAHCESNCLLAQVTDGHITFYGIINLCRSPATSRICKVLLVTSVNGRRRHVGKS